MNILKHSHKLNLSRRVGHIAQGPARAFSQVLGNSATKNDAHQVINNSNFDRDDQTGTEV